MIALSSCVKGEGSGKGKTNEKVEPAESLFLDGSAVGVENNELIALSTKIDKVEIICMFFGDYTDKSFRINLSNSTLIVKSFNESDTIYVNNGDIRNKAIKFINLFYIDKEEKIIINRTKRDELLSTDYPFIRVIGYREGNEVFNSKSQIGEEEYDVEYHPLFLGFYEFLNSMVE